MSFIGIATKDGCMYRKWGPCFCGKVKPNNIREVCISCKNADEIEASGLDWDDEYKKAAKADFRE